MYADTDFFLALLKEDDWLKKQALALLEQYKMDISTSVVTIIELLLLCKKFSIDPEELLLSVFGISGIMGIEKEHALYAAHLVKYQNFGVFDALHAALCGGKIISSDHIYDKLGIQRIAL